MSYISGIDKAKGDTRCKRKGCNGPIIERDQFRHFVEVPPSISHKTFWMTWYYHTNCAPEIRGNSLYFPQNNRVSRSSTSTTIQTSNTINPFQQAFHKQQHFLLFMVMFIRQTKGMIKGNISDPFSKKDIKTLWDILEWPQSRSISFDSMWNSMKNKSLIRNIKDNKHYILNKPQLELQAKKNLSKVLKFLKIIQTERFTKNSINLLQHIYCEYIETSLTNLSIKIENNELKKIIELKGHNINEIIDYFLQKSKIDLSLDRSSKCEEEEKSVSINLCTPTPSISPIKNDNNRSNEKIFYSPLIGYEMNIRDLLNLLPRQVRILVEKLPFQNINQLVLCKYDELIDHLMKLKYKNTNTTSNTVSYEVGEIENALKQLVGKYKNDGNKGYSINENKVYSINENKRYTLKQKLDFLNITMKELRFSIEACLIPTHAQKDVVKHTIEDIWSHKTYWFDFLLKCNLDEKTTRLIAIISSGQF